MRDGAVVDSWRIRPGVARRQMRVAWADADGEFVQEIKAWAGYSQLRSQST
jgi:hypothetical protein